MGFSRIKMFGDMESIVIKVELSSSEIEKILLGLEGLDEGDQEYRYMPREAEQNIIIRFWRVTDYEKLQEKKYRTMITRFIMTGLMLLGLFYTISLLFQLFL